MLHLVYISQIYTQKNSLEKSIVSYLQQLDRILTEDAEGLKKKIIKDISQLSAGNKRCVPIKPAWASYKEGDFTICFESTLITLHVLKVKTGRND